LGNRILEVQVSEELAQMVENTGANLPVLVERLLQAYIQKERNVEMETGLSGQERLFLHGGT